MRLPVLQDSPVRPHAVELVNSVLQRVEGGTVGLRLQFESPGNGRYACLLSRGAAHGEFADLPVTVARATVTLDGRLLEALTAPAHHAGAIEIALWETGGKHALFVGQGLDIQWLSAAAEGLR